MPKITLFFPKYFDDPCWAGSSFSLEAPTGDHREWVLGRDPTANVTLAIPSISRRHCLLAYSYAADRWTVTDLESKNGTRLNGELLPPGDPNPVQVGATLHLGPNPIHLVENEYSTENVDVTTLVGTAPLDHHTGVALAPPPPAPAPPPPKTVADTLYLGAAWLISPGTTLGMVYRLVVLAVAATVVVLVMGHK